MNITEFTQSPWLKVITVALTSIGIVLKLIQVLRKRERINPVYITRSTLLLRDQAHSVPDLQIQYKGQLTKNFSITNIALWNAGTKSIRSQDIATANKIRIAAKNGVKIFDAVILKTTMEENKFEINFNSSENVVEINFEYLDRYNGGAIQITHNGNSSNDIEILGTFISHGKIISFENKTKQAIVSTLESPVKNFFISADDKRVVFLILLIPAIIFITIALWGGAFWTRLVLVIHGLLYFGMAIFARIATKTPKEFEFIEM
jgi:hypothetical protein